MAGEATPDAGPAAVPLRPFSIGAVPTKVVVMPIKLARKFVGVITLVELRVWEEALENISNIDNIIPEETILKDNLIGD
jgi:hypothetical protein